MFISQTDRNFENIFEINIQSENKNISDWLNSLDWVIGSLEND